MTDKQKQVTQESPPSPDIGKPAPEHKFPPQVALVLKQGVYAPKGHLDRLRTAYIQADRKQYGVDLQFILNMLEEVEIPQEKPAKQKRAK